VSETFYEAVLMKRIVAVQECDATGVDERTSAGLIKNKIYE
jgi:hypothetical protein